MPKIFGREIPNIALLGGVGLLVILVVSQIPTDAAPTAQTRARKKVAAADEAGPYTKTDREAKFAAYTTPVRNVFRPLVLKSKPSAGPAAGLSGDLTGGQGTWSYGGYIEIDGVRQALIENPAAGESVYLKKGEKWRELTVLQIRDESLDVSGSDGTTRTVPIAGTEQAAAPGVLPPNGIAPVDPGAALRGPIAGAGIGAGQSAVVPMGAMEMATDSSTGNGRRRRRPRGNGGN